MGVASPPPLFFIWEALIMSTASLLFSIISGILYAILIINKFDWMNEQLFYVMGTVLLICLVGLIASVKNNISCVSSAITIMVGFLVLGLLGYTAGKIIVSVVKQYSNPIKLLWIILIGVLCLIDIIIMILKYNSTT